MYNTWKKKYLLILNSWLLLILSFSLTYAYGYNYQPTAEKLSEYEALDIVETAFNALSTSMTLFKNQPYLVSLVNNSKGPSLKTTKITRNYSEVATSEFSLSSILPAATEYELSLGANESGMFLLVTNTLDDYKLHRNLLLQSTDGNTWKLVKSFPAEWLLGDLQVNNNNMTLTCQNCEDLAKPAYIISTNNGVKWHKYSLPGSAEDFDFSSVTNDRVFAGTTVLDPDNHATSTYTLYSNDLSSTHNKWVKSHIKNLLVLTAEHENQTLNFKLLGLNQIFDTTDYLVAQAEYRADYDNTKSVTKYFTWVSKDRGLTWSLLNLDLKDDAILQFKKHGSNYHFVTAKNTDFKDFVNLESFDLNQMLADLSNYFKHQKYSYYQLTEENVASNNISNLESTFEFDNAMGFNLSYQNNLKTSFTEAMLFHSVNNNVMVEFYRLHY